MSTETNGVLRAAESDWSRLRKLFASSFRTRGAPEIGAIGVVGINQAANCQEYLLARVFWPEPGDLKLAHNQAIVFDASYIRRAHLFMREHRLAGLALFHTHPHSDQAVDFSPYDDDQEPRLLQNLRELEPATNLVSVVVGKSSQRGRVWGSAENTPRAFSTLITVGESLGYEPLNGCAPPPPPPPTAIFDRGLALTGAGALSRLSHMMAAVVGASGTGSVMCELLARAGCERITLIDHDVCKTVNLNRILHATDRDVAQRRAKVAVIKRAIEALALGCTVDTIEANVLEKDVLARLRSADIIFGCVDRALPRQLLSEFAFQYLRPYIDVGSEIGGDDHGIVSVNARTSYVAPGRPCLMCSGIVTSRQLGFESKTSSEQERVRKQGYSDDLVMDQPAVLDLNMRASSNGMMLLRHLLQPFFLTPLPITISENLVTYTTLAIRNARALNPQCNVCQQNPRLGWGDCGTSLGFDKSTVDAMSGMPGAN